MVTYKNNINYLSKITHIPYYNYFNKKNINFNKPLKKTAVQFLKYKNFLYVLYKNKITTSMQTGIGCLNKVYKYKSYDCSEMGIASLFEEAIYRCCKQW